MSKCDINCFSQRTLDMAYRRLKNEIPLPYSFYNKQLNEQERINLTIYFITHLKLKQWKQLEMLMSPMVSQ